MISWVTLITGVFLIVASFLQFKDSSDASVVAREIVQISPRPFAADGRNAIVIRKTEYKDRSWKVENWEPFVNVAGLPDLRLVHVEKGKYE